MKILSVSQSFNDQSFHLFGSFSYSSVKVCNFLYASLMKIFMLF